MKEGNDMEFDFVDMRNAEVKIYELLAKFPSHIRERIWRRVQEDFNDRRVPKRMTKA